MCVDYSWGRVMPTFNLNIFVDCADNGVNLQQPNIEEVTVRLLCCLQRMFQEFSMDVTARLDEFSSRQDEFSGRQDEFADRLVAVDALAVKVQELEEARERPES